MIGIVDYGSGNFSSVKNSIYLICSSVKTIKKPEDINECSKIILPGVGAFQAAMHKLRDLDLIEPLTQAVLNEKKPFLGICVGMQILAEMGSEFGLTPGLGWIKSNVNRFELNDSRLPLPHIGWNEIINYERQLLFQGINPDDPSFYFVHSFCMTEPIEDPTVEVAFSAYEQQFVASVRKNNIFGVQFHPEKSQKNGLKLLKNFVEYNG